MEEVRGDKLGMAVSSNNLSIIYNNIGAELQAFESALTYSNRAIEIYVSLGDFGGLPDSKRTRGRS